MPLPSSANKALPVALVALLAACSGDPGLGALPPPAAEPPAQAPSASSPPVPVAVAPPNEGESPKGSGKPCSIVDSNGPLPGGTSTQKGCDPGEICACNSQAGYSCSGTCVLPGGSHGVLSPGPQ